MKQKRRLMVQFTEEMYQLLKKTAEYETMQNGGVRQITISELLRGGAVMKMKSVWGEHFEDKLAEIRESNRRDSE